VQEGEVDLSAIIVAGVDPLICIRSYSKFHGMKDPRILNKLVITPDTAHLADHAVKFEAIDKKTLNPRVFIACFKRAMITGIYLTSVKEIH